MAENVKAGTAEELELGVKKPLLLALAGLVCLVMVILAVRTLAMRDSLAVVAAAVVLCAVMALVISLVLRGRYDAASVIAVTAMMLTVDVIYFLQGYKREFIVDQVSLFLSSILVMAVFFIRGRRAITALGICLATSYLALCFWIGLSGRILASDQPFLSQTIIPSVNFAVVMVVALFIRRVSGILLEEVQKRLDESSERAERVMEIVSRSGSNLDEVRGFSSDADSALTAARGIEGTTGEVLQRVDGAKRQADGTNAALDAILSSMEALTERAEDQSAHVAETVSSIEEMSANIKNISDITAKKREAALGLLARAGEGEKAMDESVSAFERLASSIDDILETTGIIQGIAGQTNLLAMNAAIEAAHAGDAGRGFSVVADEVRKLAETSASSARGISDNLSKLVQDIKGAGTFIRVSGEAFKRIETEIQGVVQAMEEIGEGMRETALGAEQIMRSTGVLNEVTMAVNDKAKEIKLSHGSAAEDMAGIVRTMDGLNGQMASILDGARGIRASMEGLRSRSDGLIGQTETLDRELHSL